MKATYASTRQFSYRQSLPRYHPSFFLLFFPKFISNQMALAPSASLHGGKYIPGNTGALRRPSGGSYALKSSSYFSPSLHLLMPSTQLSTAPPKFSMRLASKQAYICRDCGYIYNDRTPFEKVPDTYFCPVCGAPKRRFRAYAPPVSKGSNDTALRKARKEELQRENAIGYSLSNTPTTC
ncbi:hypothetical protein ACS0TY_034145 [Phlomoides rotata]